MPVNTVIQTRRGTIAQWAAANPILKEGEMGFETDTQKFKFGNGVSPWNDLAYWAIPGDYGYAVVNFVGNGPTGENLNVFYSPDGKSVYGGGGNPVYRDPSTNSLRDPSMIVIDDMYYVAYTRNNGFDKVFEVIGGRSLAHLAPVATINLASLPDIKQIWAPELIIDPATPTRPYVFFSKINAAGVTGSMYWIQATNDSLTTWSTAKLVSWATAPGHHIDGVPVKHVDGKWYMFYSTGSAICRAVSNTITGTYTIQKTGNWAGWGTEIEGPAISADPVSGKYRMYFDRFGADTGYWWSESSDLTTWSEPTHLEVAPYTLPPGGRMRHGTFLPLTKQSQKNMMDAITAQPVEDPYIVFTGTHVQGSTTRTVDIGTMKVHSSSRNTAMVRSEGNGLFSFLEDGDYTIQTNHEVLGATGVNRTFVELKDAGDTVTHRRFAGGAEDIFGMDTTTFRSVAGERLLIKTFVQFTGGQTNTTISNVMRIIRRSR